MSLLRRKTAQEGGSRNEPSRLPQRWVIILGLGSAATVTLSLTASVAIGTMAGVAIVGLLHKIMD
jgi:hypothetical protein